MSEYENEKQPSTNPSHPSGEGQHHPGIDLPPELPPAPTKKALVLIAMFLLVLGIAGIVTVLGRMSRARVLARETEVAAVPTVMVIRPTAESPDEELLLPGSLQPFQESPIYARTNGYLVRWYKDIGSRVQKGDLLATIDAPEVDQELSQTQAARQQILAQLHLAQISAQRWQELRKSDSVSQQEADQQSSAYDQARANLAAADANVHRLQDLEAFKNVYAPFSGVLTKRNVDAGALINAGSTGRELFDLAQVNVLRVYVSVPQAYASNIRLGMKAWVVLQEYPGQKFMGSVAHTADSIDTTTRTLLTEVDVPNTQGKLLPGSYGQVHFALSTQVERVIVPVNAMLFRSEGPRVAVVGSDDRVQLRPITIGKDYGATLEVLGGLSINERVVINPPDSLEGGQLVHVTPENQGEKKG